MTNRILKWLLPLGGILAMAMSTPPPPAANATTAAGAGDKAPKALPELSRRDAGRTLQARSGDTFRIRLEERAGTGYRWETTDLDRNLFEIKAEPQAPPPAAATAAKPLGGTTEQVWTVTCRSPGSGQIVLKYFRPWEGPEKAAAVFAVTVEIKP